MPLKKDPTIEKRTLNLTIGDSERLAALYPDLGWSKAARKILHDHVELVESRVTRPSEPLPHIEVPK